MLKHMVEKFLHSICALEISKHDCVHVLLTYFRVLPFDRRDAFEAFVCRDSNESRRDRL